MLSTVNKTHRFSPDLLSSIELYPPPMHYQVSQAVSSLKISDQIFVWISHLPQSCYTSCQSYSLLLDRPNNTVFFNHGTTALEGQGLLSVEDSLSHSDTPHSVGVTIPTQRPLPENTQHSHERHPCPRRDSNPQSQQEK
jgi:hypothetical protein